METFRTNYLSIEVEDEVLIDTSTSTLDGAGAAITAAEVTEEDTAMQIDEEGRPRFAPAKPSVRFPQQRKKRTVSALTHPPPYRQSGTSPNHAKLPSRRTE